MDQRTKAFLSAWTREYLHVSNDFARGKLGAFSDPTYIFKTQSG